MPEIWPDLQSENDESAASLIRRQDHLSTLSNNQQLSLFG